MEDKSENYLAKINQQQKQLDSLYRTASASLGISDCAMWIIYLLLTLEGQITQQDMREYMLFPKQTINSAVSSLCQKGYAELHPLAGAKNKKAVSLTVAGKQFAKGSVERIILAEKRAILKMSDDKMKQLIALNEEYACLLEKEFQQEDLLGG